MSTSSATQKPFFFLQDTAKDAHIKLQRLEKSIHKNKKFEKVFFFYNGHTKIDIIFHPAQKAKGI